MMMEVGWRKGEGWIVHHTAPISKPLNNNGHCWITHTNTDNNTLKKSSKRRPRFTMGRCMCC